MQRFNTVAYESEMNKFQSGLFKQKRGADGRPSLCH